MVHRELRGARLSSRIVVLSVLLGLTGCASLQNMSWPWTKQAPPPAEIVAELTVEGAGGTAIPQYWSRNTLVLDLTGAGSRGSATARPAFERGWPVRVAVRVNPGQFNTLEVRGAQRVVLAVTAEGATPIDIAIAPSTHPKGTPQLELAWGQSLTGS